MTVDMFQVDLDATQRAATAKAKAEEEATARLREFEADFTPRGVCRAVLVAILRSLLATWTKGRVLRVLDPDGVGLRTVVLVGVGIRPSTPFDQGPQLHPGTDLLVGQLHRDLLAARLAQETQELYQRGILLGQKHQCVPLQAVQ